MRASFSRCLVLLAAALALAGCFQTGPSPVASAAADDEALCSSRGAPGSNDYAACMKNRDVAREQSQARTDRTHRRVAEDMLNGR